MTVMIISVAVISDIFIPPDAFGIDAVVGEGFSRYDRPPRERAELEIAVGYLVNTRSRRVLNVIFILYEERSFFLRIGVFPEADIVDRKIAVIPTLVVIDYPYISAFTRILGKVEGVFVKVIGVVYACRVPCGVDGIATMNSNGSGVFITTKNVKKSDNAAVQIIMDVAIILKNLLW